ncbi:YigZ family protein [Thermoactinomyces mirandus]|uniref:YigZ family protein n=1 Tax=Thermoactinomyces mirandus TaxID=2756294 RepID=A0A7W1XTP2_9BACL|nr:YigZ family protein [Thermoactinomyces mirandus]MBA4602996.1 YigZ family protein [Thermoactinomyces mirandus]
MTQEQYLTIGSQGETEITIQKSRFICRAKHVTSEKEAQQFIHAVSKQHWDATHNCYAYLVSENIQKFSDDGEPAGTAGRPILEVIQAKQLQQTAIVITRYFGGIKLGAGGLVRAYSHGASRAIEAAGIIKCQLHQQIIFTFDYSFMGKMEYEFNRGNCLLEPPKFSDVVTWAVWLPVGQEEHFIQQAKNRTNGQTEISLGKQEFKQLPVET